MCFFLGLKEETNRLLTFGVANNTMLLFYTLLEKDLLRNCVLLDQSKILGKLIVVVVSTFCFSRFFNAKGRRFQEEIINLYGVIPTVTFALIRLELALTKNLRIGVLYILAVVLCVLILPPLYLEPHPICKIPIYLSRHLLLFYTLFRSLISVNRLNQFYKIHPSLCGYKVVYGIVQGDQITLNRNVLILIVFLLVFTVLKLSTLVN